MISKEMIGKAINRNNQRKKSQKETHLRSVQSSPNTSQLPRECLGSFVRIVVDVGCSEKRVLRFSLPFHDGKVSQRQSSRSEVKMKHEFVWKPKTCMDDGSRVNSSEVSCS